jgi:hypothetical protein
MPGEYPTPPEAVEPNSERAAELMRSIEERLESLTELLTNINNPAETGSQNVDVASVEAITQELAAVEQRIFQELYIKPHLEQLKQSRAMAEQMAAAVSTADTVVMPGMQEWGKANVKYIDTITSGHCTLAEYKKAKKERDESWSFTSI